MNNKYADRVKGMGDGEIGEFLRLVGRGDIISFAGGIPAEDIFPIEELKSLINQLVMEKGGKLFQYGSTEGSNQLKDFIIDFMQQRMIKTKREELLVTTGSQQALDLISKIFLNPGDPVLVEKPAYVGGLGAFKSYRADIRGIELGEDGPDITGLEEELTRIAGQGRAVKLIYLVPDFSNPSGIRISLEKRKRILELANRYDLYLIEDTPYSELNYYDQRLPFLKELDLTERVIFLGTFSKFFVPGLRIGWVSANQEIIKVLGRAKQSTDLASNSLGQELIARAGKQGLIDQQIERIKPYYRLRLEAMGTALGKYFPNWTSWSQPAGGFFYWVKLPVRIKSRDLLLRAIENKVAFVSGNSFFARAEDGNSFIRLSFSNSSPAEIEEGIKLLGKIIKDC